MDGTYCSFCGKANHEVAGIVVGPAMVAICDECVESCRIIIAEKLGHPVPTPDPWTALSAASLPLAPVPRSADRPADAGAVGGEGDVYLRRWWVIPRNRVFNIYLHQFLRSDDDRALHDHPWANMSLLLDGIYREHTPRGCFLRRPGCLYFRRPSAAHRVELIDGGTVWTLFLTGPRVRDWGFLCPRGWKHWKDFVSVRPGGNAIGIGCGEL